MTSPRSPAYARSLSEDVYQKLRRDIVSCRLSPGQKLNINVLCANYGVSLGAVREALSRLASDDLVVAQAQRGFRVAPVSTADLVDLMKARTEIESLCLRKSLAFGGVDWEANLVAAGHRLLRTPKNAVPTEATISDEWEAAHDAFHLALVAACDSPWLLKLRAQLYTQAERYRRLSMRMSATRRNIANEHQRLLKAAMGRDAKCVVDLMTRHLDATTRYLLEAGTMEIATPL
ncbi:MAG: FCD domain-containing protein [Sulfuritalea sp.]|nr:FCD domain-containing protein [Sulfuritalea sp.]